MSPIRTSAPEPVDPSAALALILRWLKRVLAAESFTWLTQEIEHQQAAADERRLGVALGLAGRKLRRIELALSNEDAATAQALRDAWLPQHWTADEAARVALALATHRGDDQAFAARLDRLCITAEITEQISYMKGFAVFPAGTALLPRAREAIRSSIAPVFEAIACRNPYPRDHLDIEAWNQMVVKCVFGGTPLERVVGLQERRNDELIVMLRDLVAERHAAGRPLPKDVHAFIAGSAASAPAS
jgi:hypothetical protein